MNTPPLAVLDVTEDHDTAALSSAGNSGASSGSSSGGDGHIVRAD